MKTLFLSLAFVATSAFAFPAPQTATQDMKNAGNDTKSATKKTYKKSKKSVKKGANKTATATENGANDVKNSTTTSPEPQK